ncbi:MAG: glycoside hydrolase family 3 C-terminal domain-containing protein [Melioribacteraceae bacterium]|nr:glycoside hydrolase family 3 C-terminal domain-containing protein [Melioribacteraceae bacterium]
MEKLSNNLVASKTETMLYKNPEASVSDRVKDLLNHMTTEEKIAQMLCVWGEKKNIFFDEDGNLQLDNIQNHLKDGLGQIGRLSDTNEGLSAVDMAKMSNAIQKYFIENTRLGIPVIFHEECLHGLAGKEATSYPQPIGMASTFNPELIQRIYSAIAEETRARGAHQALTPVLDVARDPRWGRVEETFGEDPYLISQLGIAAINGLQGDGTFKDKKNVIATLKHFAAHGQPESGSNCGPGNFSERILRDVFLYPFKEAVQKGKAMSVMASYNEIDGVPSHANKWLLKDVLRDEWDFNGFIVSDYYAITELNYKEETVSHSVAKDKYESAILSVNAGVNIELPDMDCYPLLTELVHSGRVDESDIDELVASLLEYKFKLGLFDDPYVNPDEVRIEEKNQRDRKIALDAARETMVLLKNDGNTLPLSIDKKTTLAVIGPNADRKMLGGYSGKPRFYTTVLEGIKEKVNGKLNVLYSEGCKITVEGGWDVDEVILPEADDDFKLIEEAVETAKKADTIILAIGGNEQTSREAWSKVHLGDRTSLDLFGRQNILLDKIAELGKPVIILLFNGRPLSITRQQGKADAVIECWYLGQETGHAVADVLFGEFNPGGKLPISFPRSVGHIPCHYNHKPSSRRGYLFDDITPLYAFGYGLSYTSFEICDVKLSKGKIGLNESVKVSLIVKNKGQRAGTEVVQLYIRDVHSSVTRPVKELKGFNKVNLKPGENKSVEFEIKPEHLAFTSINKEFVVEPGEFEIMIGNSSRSEDLVTLSLIVE